MALIYNLVKNYLISSERIILWHLGFRNPPDGFAIALADNSAPNAHQNKNTLALDFLQDPFLWAVPKHRRSIFRRRQRRYGSIENFCKLLLPKTSLLICTDCGSHKEAGRLCPTCYTKVKVETEIMQDTIEKELGLSPVDKEVVVLYDGEQIDVKHEFWKGKRIVELKKERPPWFSKNLLQPTTQSPATSAVVEPKDLA